MRSPHWALTTWCFARWRSRVDWKRHWFFVGKCWKSWAENTPEIQWLIIRYLSSVSLLKCCHLDPLKEPNGDISDTIILLASLRLRLSRISTRPSRMRLAVPESEKELTKKTDPTPYLLALWQSCPKNLTKWGTLGNHIPTKKKLIHIKSHSPSIPIPFSGGVFPDLSFGARALQLASAWIATGPNWAPWQDGGTWGWDGMGWVKMISRNVSNSNLTTQLRPCDHEI